MHLFIVTSKQHKGILYVVLKSLSLMGFDGHKTMMENFGPTLEFLLSWVKAWGNQIIWDGNNWAQPNPNQRAAADLKKVFLGL